MTSRFMYESMMNVAKHGHSRGLEAPEVVRTPTIKLAGEYACPSGPGFQVSKCHKAKRWVVCPITEKFEKSAHDRGERMDEADLRWYIEDKKGRKL